MSIRKYGVVLFALFALAACHKGKGEHQIEVRYICVPLIEYSPEFQEALDREVASIDAPYLFQILNDNGITREGIRKCIADRKKAEEQARRSKKGKKK
jgi:hypothetical protein